MSTVPLLIFSLSIPCAIDQELERFLDILFGLGPTTTTTISLLSFPNSCLTHLLRDASMSERGPAREEGRDAKDAKDDEELRMYGKPTSAHAFFAHEKRREAHLEEPDVADPVDGDGGLERDEHQEERVRDGNRGVLEAKVPDLKDS